MGVVFHEHQTDVRDSHLFFLNNLYLPDTILVDAPCILFCGGIHIVITFCPVLIRIERIEFLDEVDLLHQLLSHYCIAWAVNDAAQLGEQNL